MTKDTISEHIWRNRSGLRWVFGYFIHFGSFRRMCGDTAYWEHVPY